MEKIDCRGGPALRAGGCLLYTSLVRDDVLGALEAARAAKTIGKSLEAKVSLHCDGELYDFLASRCV